MNKLRKFVINTLHEHFSTFQKGDTIVHDLAYRLSTLQNRIIYKNREKEGY